MVKSDVFSWVTKIASNMQQKNATGIPSAYEYWQALTDDSIHLVMLIISAFATFFIWFLAGIQVYYVARYTSNEGIRGNLYFLIFMAPVTGITSVFGMSIPRSAAFLYAVNLSYYMLCLFIVVKLMFTMFGNRKALLRYLIAHERPIRLNVPPYFQRLSCLPEFSATQRNLSIVEAFILQTVIVRIVLQVTELLVYFELGSRTHAVFTVSHVVGLISMFVAFYFVYVIIDLGKERLAPYKFATLFRILDLAQTLASLQKFVIDFMVAIGWVHATKVLNPNGAGTFYLGFILCLEMLGLSLLTTYIFHPSETPLFDRYQGNIEEPTTSTRKVIQILNSIDQEDVLNREHAKLLASPSNPRVPAPSPTRKSVVQPKKSPSPSILKSDRTQSTSSHKKPRAKSPTTKSEPSKPVPLS